MLTAILATKLYSPPVRADLVTRPRLLERLNAGLERKLTLISAPAGFGKTTLVSSWIDRLRSPAIDKSNIQNRVAWLSLDELDNNPARFFSYFIAALQTIHQTFGAGMVEMVQSPQPPANDVVLTALLNELSNQQDKIILVLDDYHLLEAPAIDQALVFLLDHLPSQMHIVITTREDPQIPLARYRARAQLNEVRANDLRFTPAEAADFLNQVMESELSASEVTILESRTEGWVAGLQLAALSLRGRADVASFVKAFGGDNRYIVDYLAEEVLQRQPEALRSFLLQTAILKRLNGSLCDAVTRQTGGNAQLEFLERGNFFVIPLDDQRQWYRYHHLFADVLLAHLKKEQPDQIATLHRRASDWYEQQGALADAIHHALTAQDFERAAALVEHVLPTMRRNRHDTVMLGWLTALPEEVIQCRPVLSLGYAWALLAGGKLDAVEPRLRDAERWLDTTADRHPEQQPKRVVVDEEQFRLLPGMIAIYRAAHALTRGDVPNTVKYAQSALDFFPEEELLGSGAAVALLGLAFWTNGELEAAHRTYADGMAKVQIAGNLSDVISSTIALADIRIAQGRLGEAMRAYEQALQLAQVEGEPTLQGTADLYVGMSELHCEYNDLNAAERCLRRSKELGEHTGLPQNRSRWYVAMARVRESQSDLDGALELLYEAERLYVGDLFPNVRPIAALKARLWVNQGRLGEALGWARAQGLSVDDELAYLREFEHITLARILLAQYRHAPAEHSLLAPLGLLDRLRQVAQAGKRTGSVIEILILQALAYQTQGDTSSALASLKDALTLAEPEGYIRIFVDEGLSMRRLLAEGKMHGAESDPEWPSYLQLYADKLLSAFAKGNEEAQAQATASVRTQTTPAPATIHALVESLSERELEVLRLLASDLSGPEIARQLMISLNTLRTHTKNIFSKLSVNNRRAAVRRAEELALL